ncbi:MAG: glycosyltransferase family 4 protein [Pseudomonadota bacterium]
MRLLFVHQNFPGQYKHLAGWLAAQKQHELVALGQRDATSMAGIRYVRYRPNHAPSKNAYALSRYWEECAGHGFGAAQAAEKLKSEGFVPDVILGHVGWGELTFLKLIWPHTPIVGYFEYFYRATGGSVGFDPEFPASDHAPFIMHARNAVNFTNLHSVDLGLSPTLWQRNTFPQDFHQKIYVCHDGVRTDLLRPDPKAELSLGRLDTPLTRADEVFTFVARNMEPTRGFHQFMRALPAILDARPKARAVIIGGNESSYGRESPARGGYRAQMEAELGDRVDWERVHFVGRVPYADFCRIIQISRCHIYLTVPFVLSWSLLEAMAMEATIIAADVPPVREVIEDGTTGLLTDFFDPQALAERVRQVLERPENYAHLGVAARKHVVAHYDFETVCLPEHLRRLNALVGDNAKIKHPHA